MIHILQVVVGMPRSEVAQVTASARIERTSPDEYISAEEVESLKSIALETYPLPNPDNQIMYGAVAQSFSIDDEIQLVENEVVGTLSSALEGNFKVFIGNRRATTALDKIFNSLDIAVAKKYFLPAVVARTVLTDEEMAGGVALVDVGAGVTSVAIYHGVNASILGHDLYALSQTSAVQLSDLPDALQASLREGVVVNSEEDARRTIESYREQIEADKEHAQQVADKSTAGTETSHDNPATPKADEEGE
jgi:hypothetical protein